MQKRLEEEVKEAVDKTQEKNECGLLGSRLNHRLGKMTATRGSHYFFQRAFFPLFLQIRVVLTGCRMIDNVMETRNRSCSPCNLFFQWWKLFYALL